MRSTAESPGRWLRPAIRHFLRISMSPLNVSNHKIRKLQPVNCLQTAFDIRDQTKDRSVPGARQAPCCQKLFKNGKPPVDAELAESTCASPNTISLLVKDTGKDVVCGPPCLTEISSEQVIESKLQVGDYRQPVPKHFARNPTVSDPPPNRGWMSPAVDMV